MAQLLKNNAFSTLSLSLTSASTSMTLVDASAFPEPTGGDYFLATLIGFGSNGAENSWEIVRCTARASNTLTIVRAQEGTTAQAWPAAAQVQMRLTAGSMATKADLASPAFTGTVTGITKAMVGLGSVDNTADSAKVVASAAKLTTARTIGGVSFDGTANINLPGVNAAGNQNTTGNAATATALQTARTINGVSFNGTANITVTDGTKMPLSGGTFTGLTYFPNGRLRATGSFNIDGSEPNATGHDDGLYVADFGGTSGTTQNPAFAAAIVGRLSNTRNVALTVDAGGYIYGFRTHTAPDTYTWRSKVKYADRLTTARTINGTLFDGSANITTNNWGAARTITIGGSGKSVDGSAAVTWSLADIGAQAALVSGTNIKSINGSSVLGSGNIDIAAGVTDAPSDGKNYARKDGAWAEIAAGGSGKIARVARTSNTTLSAEDNGKLIDITSGTFTQTFDSAATLGSGWWCYLGNSGTGDITLDPNGAETIDGLTSYVMYPGEMRLVQCDGSSLRTVVLKAFRKVFTSSGTFTKPPNYKSFFGLVVGGGGGGAGGNRGAFDYPYPGGGGGGGGARAFNTFQAAQFSSSTVITVGAGGSGGPSSSSNNNGTAGTSGGSSSIDGLLYASGGAFANANSEGAGGNGGAGGCFYWDSANSQEAFHIPGINGIGVGGAPSNPAKFLTSCGGGNGGAVKTGNTPNAGVRGVGISNSSGLSEILGGAGGAVGNPGSAGVSGAGYVGTGGGGGASTATTGYSGGAGGWPGGGGGGGGGLHGHPGSTGGDGAAGTVVIEGIV